MLRVATLVVGGLLVSGMVLSAQDAVSEVRQTLDARAAAVVKYVKAYERFLADDVRWINSDGTVNNKKDRLNGLPAEGPPPTLSEADIRVSW